MNRQTPRGESYAVVYGLCPPSQFSLKEAKEKLDKKTKKCYTQFINYKINTNINP